MKMKVIGMLAAFTLAASAAAAQELPRKVNNVEVLDLDGNPAKLPHWGEKNLMIFYVDPDRHKQNNDFTVELEENHRAQSDNIFGFGVMNLKDAPMVPNGMARNMAKKRTAKNGALVLADQDRILSKAWELGDCNNQFVLMIVSKEGELVFLRKGVLSSRTRPISTKRSRSTNNRMLRKTAVLALALCFALQGAAQEGVYINGSDTLHYSYTPLPEQPQPQKRLSFPRRAW